MRIRLWVLVLVLLTGAIIQLAQWRDIRKAQGDPTTDQVTYQHHDHQTNQWSKRVTNQQANRARLETKLLWRAPDALLPVLSKGALESGVRITGVAPQPTRHRKNYQFHPIELTFLGDTNGIASLLSVVESLSPTVRIDALRIKPVRSSPTIASQTLSLRLTLAPLVKVNGRGQPLTMPRTKRLTLNRNPFETGGPRNATPAHSEHRTAPQPRRGTEPAILTAILYDATRPVAILFINGIHLTATVGAEIDGGTITHIYPHSITIKRGTTTETRSLWHHNGPKQEPPRRRMHSQSEKHPH